MQIFTLKDKAQKSNRKKIFPLRYRSVIEREKGDKRKCSPLNLFFFLAFSLLFGQILVLSLSSSFRAETVFFSAKNGISNLHENGLQKILTAIDAVICKDQRKDFGVVWFLICCNISMVVCISLSLCSSHPNAFVLLCCWLLYSCRHCHGSFSSMYYSFSVILSLPQREK